MIVSETLNLIVAMHGYEGYFEIIIDKILNMFLNKPITLKNRGKFIIRKLSLSIGVEKVYSGITEIIATGRYSREFQIEIIKLMEVLLLTDPKLEETRYQMKT
jgi:hypothetical protein